MGWYGMSLSHTMGWDGSETSDLSYRGMIWIGDRIGWDVPCYSRPDLYLSENILPRGISHKISDIFPVTTIDWRGCDYILIQLVSIKGAL